MTDSDKVSDSPGIPSDHPVVSEVETESTNTTGQGTEAAGIVAAITNGSSICRSGASSR